MTKSLFEELDSIVPDHNKFRLVESKADHIVTSAINLLRLLRENFSEEEAASLEKRFFSSIRNEDFRRFERGVKKIQEDKQ